MLVLADLTEYITTMTDVIDIDPPIERRVPGQLARVVSGLLSALADPLQLHIISGLYISLLTGCRHSEVRYIRTNRRQTDYEIIIWQPKQKRERRLLTSYRGAAIIHSLVSAVETYGIPSRTAISRWMRRRAANVRSILPAGIHNASHLCRHIHVSILATVWKWSRQRLAKHMDVASSTVTTYLALLEHNDLPAI